MPSVRLVDVTKRFGRIEAIDDVSLEVRSGEYVCILGPTGSGKTTLLRLIAGLLTPDEGEIFIDDKLVNTVPPEERNAVYFPQYYALFPHMTVLENVNFGPSVRGMRLEDALDVSHRMLEMVRLDHRADSYPDELSGGMQQRVALARGLASGAKLLLLDEPISALDARLRDELRYELKGLVKSLGLTAVHVTHDQREAMIVSDRIVILRKGRIEQVGTPYHLYLRPDTLFVANFVGETNFLEGIVSETDTVGSFVELRGGLRVRVRETTYLRGERVIVAVRQEFTSVRSSEWSGINALRGEVKAIRFLGRFVKCEVRLSNGDVVSSKVPTSKAMGLPSVGDTVMVNFRPVDSVVYSYPTLGLAREIEVS